MYLRQQIQLTGLGSPIFKRTVDTIKTLDHLFSRKVPDGRLNPLQFSSAFGDVALEPSNRYFTTRKEDPNSIDLPFQASVDPKGFLREVRQSTIFHGEDNQVLYFAAVVDEGVQK